MSSEDDRIIIGTDPEGNPEKLVAQLDGDSISMTINPDISLLENLLEDGQTPPYSCMDGACLACMAKLKKGRVFQVEMGVLTEDNIEANEILTCQAKALSTDVEIDYDQL